MSETVTKVFYTIGQVVDLLKGSFSDVTISKIRFLEDEGLIKPERTAGGYRKFREDDVKRLKSILKLQKDQYLPLSVIKRNMHLINAGIDKRSANRKDLEEAFYLEEPKKISVSDAIKKVRVNKKQIDDLVSFSIIDSNGKQEITELDLEVLSIAKSLSKFGIEPRHLKMYNNFADKESLLIYQIVAPHAKNKKRLEENVSDLKRILKKLKTVLLKRALLEQFDENS